MTEKTERVTGEGKAPRVEERPEIVAEFERLGFAVEDTGGGCQWMRKQLNENVSLVITDGEGGLPELTAQLYVLVGEHSETIAKSELQSARVLADLLWKGGLGL